MIALTEQVGKDFLARPAEDNHVVQFYEDEAFLFDRVAHFLGAGLIGGEPIIVIATQAHREAFCQRLNANAFDVARACASGQLTFLDAAETLAQFMVDGMPDAARFQATVGGQIEAILTSRGPARVRAFGEMVDLLWRQGNTKAALRLEELWNELGAQQPISLLCAYVMANFYKSGDASHFNDVCTAHTHVIPTERYSTIGADDERLREISRLQQRAQALESEIERRTVVERDLRDSRQELKDFVENAVEGLHWVGADGIIQWANRAEMELLGYSPDEYVGHHISEFHADAAAIDDILARLGRNEILRNQEARLKCKDGSIKHVLIDSNVAWKEGRFLHTCCFTRDITQRKQTEMERSNLLMQAPVATALMIGPEHRFELANPLYCAMVGRAVVGKTYLEAFPELAQTPLPGILDRVYQTGEPFVTNEMAVPLDKRGNGTREDCYFKFNLQPIRNAVGQIYGMMAVAVEVTDQVRARRELEAAQQQLRTLVDSIPALAWTARADGWLDFYNRRWYEYTGATPEQLEGWGWQSVHDPVELPKVMERWTTSIATGQPFEMSFPLRRADGVFRWHLTRVIPILDDAGRVIRWFGTNTDVDDQLRAEKQLAEANRVNETLNRIGKTLNAELDLDKLVQALTDEATALCHAEFGAFFYNVLNDKGESYMLYALAGVPREAFANFPMPRNTAIFAPTFRGEGVVRLDDVTKDPRFGKNAPHHGMPKGHLPVRSYLAVPVVSRGGEVLGGLFFGHSQAGVFSARDEHLLVAVGAQAATAIDNARLYDAERRARATAERSQQRTAKLHAITASLSRVLTAEEAIRIVIRETLPIIGAASGGVLLMDAAGIHIEKLVIDEHSDARATAEAQRLSAQMNMPIFDAARTGKPVWVPTAAEIARQYPHLVDLRDRSDAQAWGAIPLIFEGRTIGSLGFRCAEECHLSVEDEHFLLAVGQQCAQAIERARLYDETRTARAAAEGASQAKDEFLAMLGHELRNPLSPIVTALQLMKLRGDVKSTREQDIIERQVHHLVRLVDDLLDISKITRGKVQLDKRSIELSAIVAKAVEIASPLFEHRSHGLSISVPREGMWLHADETRLAQVIANLLTNAAKYTDAGGEISLRAWRDGHEVVIQVKDNGIGIPATLLPHVFDLFVQGYRASDRGQGGLGIGLALVRNLVSLHHGTVAALSEGEGRGSEFVVRLPAAQPPAAIVATPSAESSPQAKPSNSVSRRVLVVDDNEDAAELLAAMLTAVGHDVAVAHDGPQALALLDRFEPEIAVLDIGLPVMDGYELAAKLRERLASRPPRLMAVTGYGQEHDRQRSRDAGFELHFVKPLHPDTLLAALEKEPA